VVTCRAAGDYDTVAEAQST